MTETWRDSFSRRGAHNYETKSAMSFLFWLALISFSLAIFAGLEVAYGMKRMSYIGDVSPSLPGDPPRISIIIPACNEAKTIEPALKSVLALDYPHLEIIVINDRSTDDTGKVLQKIQRDHPNLTLLGVSHLPNGWLGKTHALQYGADQATGEWLLFTDADIIMEESTLSRAVHHVTEKKLDHLSLFFENITPGGILNTLLLDLAGGLMVLFKPWLAKNKQSKRFMGVGAFNMVKTTAYQAINGHHTFSMHPIDDIMLGKVIKQKGFAQDCLLGHRFVRVRWYNSVQDLIDGVMKNSFAIYHYSPLKVLFSSAFICLISILPFWGVFLTSGFSQIFFGATVITRILSISYGYSFTKLSPLHSLWIIITPYLNLYITFKAMFITLAHDGINWRGTHYSLDQLKKQGKLY